MTHFQQKEYAQMSVCDFLDQVMNVIAASTLDYFLGKHPVAMA